MKLLSKEYDLRQVVESMAFKVLKVIVFFIAPDRIAVFNYIYV